MAEIIQLRNNPHDEAQQLLPWLVNGSLSADEAERGEGHLAVCEECRTEVDAERRLAAAIESMPINSDAAWERIEQRLEAQPQVDLSRAAGVWRKRVPFGWAVISPLAAAAAVAVLIINVPSRQPTEPLYRALGASEISRPANLVVQFQPATRVSAMQAALQSVDARLTDGPTATGAYLLRVDQSKRELALKRLRDNQSITLAEPIDGPTPG